MKTFKILTLAALTAVSLTSCEDFLDSENYVGKDSSTFPVSETDVNQMVAAVYKSTFYGPWENHNDVDKYWIYANLASDDELGGGGQNDVATQALDLIGVNTTTQMGGLWDAAYEAINRANSALENVGNIADEDLRNQTEGELRSLRAYNYFDLVKCFERIPMIEKAPDNVQEAQTSPEQIEPDVVYKQIATDLYKASQIMPKYTYDGWSKLTYGKISVWAAKSLLARVFLFYTGFYNKTSLPADESVCGVSEITKDMVTTELKDVVDNSGHGLLDDYRSIWPYANQYTKKDYTNGDGDYAAYAEGNKEVVMAINYTYLSDWSATKLHISNQYALFFGVRAGDQNETKFNKDDANSVYPLGMGWGCGPVSPAMISDWKAAEPNDPRLGYSVYTLPSGFDWNSSDTWMQGTGYHQMKVCPIRSSGGNAKDGGFYTYCAEEQGGETTGHFQASSYQSMNLIRFSDCLLMLSELTEDAQYMNRVRARVGLPAVSYSLQNLQNERRWELAFEGLRWDDMRRWHIAADCLDKQTGVDIINAGTKTTNTAQIGGYKARYNATNGFYKIPQEQIDLSDGAYKQNAGWEGTTGFYGSWQ